MVWCGVQVELGRVTFELSTNMATVTEQRVSGGAGGAIAGGFDGFESENVLDGWRGDILSQLMDLWGMVLGMLHTPRCCYCSYFYFYLLRDSYLLSLCIACITSTTSFLLVRRLFDAPPSPAGPVPRACFGRSHRDEPAPGLVRHGRTSVRPAVRLHHADRPARRALLRRRRP
jgi:hypothetical protein